MGHLQEVGHVLQNAILREREVLLQNSQFFISLGKIEHDLRLQAGMDVLRQIECRRIVVHRRDKPEVGIGLDLDAGHNRLHVPARIQQWREAGPTLLAHPIAFIQDRDSAANHRCDQRRRNVAQLPFAAQ